MRIWWVLALCTVVSGCATGNQKIALPSGLGLPSGLENARLGPDSYRISVQGYAYASSDRAEQIMLLRASELTLQNGFDKFLVEQREVKTYQQLASGGASMSYTTQSRPNAFMIIRMLKSDDPRAKTALDAATVDAELRSR